MALKWVRAWLLINPWYERLPLWDQQRNGGMGDSQDWEGEMGGARFLEMGTSRQPQPEERLRSEINSVRAGCSTTRQEGEKPPFSKAWVARQMGHELLSWKGRCGFSGWLAAMDSPALGSP
jgi:hypothetical protein